MARMMRWPGKAIRHACLPNEVIGSCFRFSGYQKVGVVHGRVSSIAAFVNYHSSRQLDETLSD